MASTARKYDCFIFGGGLAGSVLAHTLIQQGKQPLVIDLPGKSRCSQVAAGLINPIGGRRLNLIWKANTLIPFATSFYRSLEKRHQTQFFHPRKIARLFANPDERKQWQKRESDTDYIPWIDSLDSLKTPREISVTNDDGFAVKDAGYLDMPHFIQTLRGELASQESLVETEFDYSKIEVTEDCVKWRKLSAPYAIFCEGHLATANPWFPFVPLKPAKGIIGSIVSDVEFGNTAIIKKYFLLPRHDKTIGVGATYDWNNIDEIADAKGTTELEAFLDRMLGNQWKWTSIAAGIRPATAGAKPVVGPNPENPRILSFNGFGSKGATQTPYLAQTLHDFIWNEEPLPSDVLPARFIKTAQAKPKRWIAVEIARNRVLEILKAGDTAVDATAGNGHDTLWLAQRTGPSGHVFAFDVQKKAIENARIRLQEANSETHVQFINDCHSKLSENLPEDIQITAAVFNLGYLPGSNQSIKTRPSTTIQALKQSLQRLKPGGILSVVIYPGHDGGNGESIEILDWIQQLDPKRYRHETEHHPAGIAHSPFPLFVLKH
jgi:glycine oxidase